MGCKPRVTLRVQPSPANGIESSEMRLLGLVPLALVPMAFARSEPLSSQGVLDDPALAHFYNLEFDQALAGFRAAAAKSPNSADLQNHIAQTVLYREMYRAGMLQTQLLGSSNLFLKTPKLTMDETAQQEFTGAIQRAMELEKSGLGEDRDDAATLYSAGVTYSLQGQYNFTRKAYVDAIRDMCRARKLHARATRAAPDFVDARLTLGVYDYVVGSLPFGLKVLGFLGGFQGNRTRGIATIQRVANDGNINRIDASILLAAIYRREHRSADAVCVFRPLIAQLPRNYLLRLELAETYADLGDRSMALQVVDQVEQLWRASAPGYEKLNAELLRKVRDQIS